MKKILTELPFGLAGTIYRSPLPFSPVYDPKGELIDAYKAGWDCGGGDVDSH